MQRCRQAQYSCLATNFYPCTVQPESQPGTDNKMTILSVSPTAYLVMDFSCRSNALCVSIAGFCIRRFGYNYMNILLLG